MHLAQQTSYKNCLIIILFVLFLCFLFQSHFLLDQEREVQMLHVSQRFLVSDGHWGHASFTVSHLTLSVEQRCSIYNTFMNLCAVVPF